MLTIDERDLVHTLRVVLGENRGNTLTDSLCHGIEHAILTILTAMPANQGEQNNAT